jgi:prolyl-tRNA editing enzyme YbaK/EbsC (Cys-tRNA(Pro) deacylase)
LLEKLGVAYREVLDHPACPRFAGTGRAAGRRRRRLMVLFPQSQLLDLNRLAELTGRRLTAVSPRLEKMLGKHQLSLLPGLPALTSSPCLYEKPAASRSC